MLKLKRLSACVLVGFWLAYYTVIIMDFDLVSFSSEEKYLHSVSAQKICIPGLLQAGTEKGPKNWAGGSALPGPRGDLCPPEVF